MAENIIRTKGTSKAYKPDAGNAPVDAGPHIAIVKSTIDSARSGKILVYINRYGGTDENDPSFWIPVSYVSPFYGTAGGANPPESGDGGFTLNKHSYGMWFTPPDKGSEVIVFFVNGDRQLGFYLGSPVNPNAHHMVPAIGASPDFPVSTNPLYEGVTQLPVIEINDNNKGLVDSAKFFDAFKPIHQTQTYNLLKQGLLKDTVRGTIASNSYRESPSSVYGFSTPGRPIFEGGNTDMPQRIRNAYDEGTPLTQELDVVGRLGGHSIVLDDGDIVGNDQLVRIRTAAGHQILLSDSGQTLYFIHANGQTWMELGSEGTIDLYATNSVNIRSEADINLHADRNINMNAKNSININADVSLAAQAGTTQLTGTESLVQYSEKYVGIKSDTTLSLKSKQNGTWNGGSALIFSAGCIDLNGPSAPDVPTAISIPKNSLPDVRWNATTGWTVTPNSIETVVTRAPTHEPYPNHGAGLTVVTNLNQDTSIDLDPELEILYDDLEEEDFLPSLTVTDYETQAYLDKSVGSLNSDQVTALLAEANVSVAQNSSAISDTLGLGKYGFGSEELEKAGLLKPGTTDFYLSNGESLATTLASPTVWTGKDGVSGLSNILGDDELQDQVKGVLYDRGLNELRANGLVTGQEEPAKLGGLLQAASKYGGSTVKQWTENTLSNPTLSTTISQTVRGGKYAVDLVDKKVTATDRDNDSITNTSTGTTTSSVSESFNTVVTTSKVGGEATTRVAAPPTPPSAEMVQIQSQIDNLEIVVKSGARASFFENNPNASSADWLRSDEFKALRAQRRELDKQYLEAQKRRDGIG